jgi:hypothetical protein
MTSETARHIRNVPSRFVPEHAVPVFVGHPQKEPIAIRARVVDEHVDPLAGRGHQRQHTRRRRDVALHRHGADLLGERPRLVGARAVAGDHARAARRELASDSPRRSPARHP